MKMIKFFPNHQIKRRKRAIEEVDQEVEHDLRGIEVVRSIEVGLRVGKSLEAILVLQPKVDIDEDLRVGQEDREVEGEEVGQDLGKDTRGIKISVFLCIMKPNLY